MEVMSVVPVLRVTLGLGKRVVLILMNVFKHHTLVTHTQIVQTQSEVMSAIVIKVTKEMVGNVIQFVRLIVDMDFVEVQSGVIVRGVDSMAPTVPIWSVMLLVITLDFV